MAETSGKRWPLHGVRLNPNYPCKQRSFRVVSLGHLDICLMLAAPLLDIEAEVLYATRSEYACTAVDIIARRTRLAFVNAQTALDVLPRVIDIMAEELHWDEKRKKKEWLDGRKFLVSMGLDEVGALPEDARLGSGGMEEKGTRVRWWNPVNWVGLGRSLLIGSKGATTSSTVHPASYSRAHFSLDELAKLKDGYTERTSSSSLSQSTATDDTVPSRGLSADEILEIVRDELGYLPQNRSRPGGVKDVYKALGKVGVKDAQTSGRTFTFDEFVDVSPCEISRFTLLTTTDAILPCLIAVNRSLPSSKINPSVKNRLIQRKRKEGQFLWKRVVAASEMVHSASNDISRL